MIKVPVIFSSLEQQAMSILLETSLGDLVFDLEISKAPNSSRRFMEFSRLKIWNNLTCSKIEKNFACFFEAPDSSLSHDTKSLKSCEIRPDLKHDRPGAIGWSSALGFYVTLTDKLPSFDSKTFIFGYLAEGLDVLETINEALTDPKSLRPFIPFRIKHTVQLEDPFDHAFEEAESPEEFIDLAEEKELADPVELEERAKAALQAAQEVSLELLGDLPNADTRPPENVLFVCKLNPCTDAEDLRIIFSRFGEVLACDVMKDQKTGDSLQYGFVEYANRSDCEKAFLGLQNVIVDDRRIKVDFSQSVGKNRWDEWHRSVKRRRIE